MRYIGSKHKLLPFLKEQIYQVAGVELSQKVFCDMFAGSGVVGQAFKNDVKQLIANDLEEYSFVLNKTYIQTPYELNNKDVFLHAINSLTPIQ